MKRTLALFVTSAVLVGCRSYIESTPRQLLEGDHAANYARIFRSPTPANVTVVNSMVVTYSFRPGVVTTDDFEFELVAPVDWIRKQSKRWYMRKGDGELIERQLDARRADARAWYAPDALDHYDLYRDLSSVGYVHMLVQKEPESDGRRRVFISKH